MSIPTLVGTQFGGSGFPMILGPSLGTPTLVWEPAVSLLTSQFRVLAFDRYFTGHLEDSVNDMKYTVGSPRYGVAGGPTFTVPAHATSTPVTVTSDPNAGPSTAAGLLLLYRVNGGSESSVVGVN